MQGGMPQVRWIVRMVLYRDHKGSACLFYIIVTAGNGGSVGAKGVG